MSIQAVAYVLESHIPDPTAKLVMISLANALNGKTGQCNPSISQICNEASASKSTVIRKLQWLAEQGWIDIVPQFDGNRRQTHNAYRLSLSEAEEEGVNLTPRGFTGDTGEGVTTDTPLKEPEDITGKEILSETVASDGGAARKKRKTYPEAFESAWAAYPTDPNMSKKEAYDAWSRLDSEDRALVSNAIPGFIAYCKSHRDYRPIHMCRFIRFRRFEGFASAADTPPAGGINWADWVDAYFAEGIWKDHLGPRPGEPGCRAPPEIVEQARKAAA